MTFLPLLVKRKRGRTTCGDTEPSVTVTEGSVSQHVALVLLTEVLGAMEDERVRTPGRVSLPPLAPGACSCSTPSLSSCHPGGTLTYIVAHGDLRTACGVRAPGPLRSYPIPCGLLVHTGMYRLLLTGTLHHASPHPHIRPFCLAFPDAVLRH
jgi:hypothetical protein